MNTNSYTKKEKILRRIWGMLPSLFLAFLIVIVLVNASRIKTESERIKAEKLASMHKERPSVNVVTLDINHLPVRDSLDLPAQVEAWVDLKVSAEVQGKVREMLVTEGQHIKKGDLIAVIDTRDYENELASARAEYLLAEKNHTRTKDLFEEKLVTKAQYDSDLSRFENLKASLRNAELRLERCHIRAPITGIINRLDAKVGMHLNVQDPVAVILDISRVKVCSGIPESDVDDVRRLEHFDIALTALDKTVRGRKYFLSRSPESLAHIYKLEIVVDNPGGDILPGMFARVNIIKKEVKDGIAVPLYSVISRGDEKFVLVENSGAAHARPVETGILDGWKVQVTKGLSVNDHVIVVGHRGLDEGQKVNVIRRISKPEELSN
ncbi:MAG: efflux RND transporter periplasmic adaptor subunit [Nitrospiraceae bacterium]|nr:MAG: efflux RND transporter periplasmic adaptor subunit [Nitrospiraceae bacterium]